MQGRQGPGEDNQDSSYRSATGAHRFSDPSATGAHRFSDLTGREAVIPQRPPGMTYLNQPPPARRVARPQRQKYAARRRKTWKWWIGALVLFAFGAVIIGVIAFGISNLFLAASVSEGAANTAVDFLSNLQGTNYSQAYDDLNATITYQLSSDAFKQIAQADDHCYGQVTSYSEISGSATSLSNGNIMSFAYTISRSKLSKTYRLQLTVQKDSTGNWTITNYGSDLGPAPPTCK